MENHKALYSKYDIQQKEKKNKIKSYLMKGNDNEEDDLKGKFFYELEI